MSVRSVALGLRANRGQFALLLAVNAFVGAMVGVERSALPLAGRDEFALAAAGVAAFVAAFGAAKAVANLAAGRLANRLGRRRTLLLGWTLALPVPVVVGFAPDWAWVVGANGLLGASQGLAWTMTVLMKLELVGPRQRGLTTGLNEFTGYLAVGVAAFLASLAAATVDLRAGPAALGFAIAVLGLGLALATRDTGAHALLEDEGARAPRVGALARVAVWQAGFVNNANDALAWALVPLFLVDRGAELALVGLVTAVYPATWSVSQLATGALSDRYGRGGLVVSGMLVQALAIVALVAGRAALPWIAAAALWGLGTAMVYPTLLAAAADLSTARERPRALGAYRFWRDAGLVLGALGGGAIATSIGLDAALTAGAALTAASGLAALPLRHLR